MQAAFYNFKKDNFELRPLPMPRLRRGEVLVKIYRSAICGSDIHTMRGIARNKAYNQDEIILGHMWSGVVVKVGSGVSGFRVGNKVSGLPYSFCGRCKRCLAGQENICESYKFLGMETPGTHLNYAVFKEKILYKLPADANLNEAALFIDVFCTAYHGLKKVQLKKDSEVVIFGGGPVGLATGMILRKIFGVRKIKLVERESYRRALGTTLFGADVLLAKKLNPDSADLFVETSGSEEASKYALRTLKRGGTFLLIGVSGSLLNFPIVKMISREISILGSLTATRKDIQEFVGMFQKLNSKKLITHILPLKHADKAYKLFQSGKSGSVLLDSE